MPTPSGEKKQLTTLVAVSQALASTLHLEAALHRVLELLERQHAMFPSIVTLLQGEAAELTITAAHGLTHGASRRAIAWVKASLDG
jgi:Nif-specific regulatory protein